MKQRLLLALLMLLTSAGFMKVDGQTIVLPKSETGEKVTLTFTGKFTSNSYPVVYGTKDVSQVKVEPTRVSTSEAVYNLASSVNADTTYTFNNDYASAWEEVGVTLDGKVSQFKASTGSEKIASHFSSLVFTNNDTLQVLNLEQASKIKTLNASGNDELTTIYNLGNLKDLETFNISNCGFTSLNLNGLVALKYLNVSNNKIESIGGIPDSIESLDISKNGYAASGAKGVWDLSTYENLKKLNIDGNKLKIVKVTDELLKSDDFKKGIQDFTAKDLDEADRVPANKDLNLDEDVRTKLITTGNVTIDYAESWKKLNDKTNAYEDTSDPQKTVPGNGLLYRFFDSNKVLCSRQI